MTPLVTIARTHSKTNANNTFRLSGVHSKDSALWLCDEIYCPVLWNALRLTELTNDWRKLDGRISISLQFQVSSIQVDLDQAHPNQNIKEGESLVSIHTWYRGMMAPQQKLFYSDVFTQPRQKSTWTATVLPIKVTCSCVCETLAWFNNSRLGQLQYYR